MEKKASDQRLRALYQEVILDHHRRPRHRGKLADPHFEVEMNNPTCGDEICLQVRVEGDLITEAAFTGQGCSISQASASMMLEMLTGKSAATVRQVADRFRQMIHGDESAAADPLLGNLRALAGVAQYPARVRCAMLAWTALEEVTPR